MTIEWHIRQWHVVHGVDRYVSVLVMVRIAFISRDATSIIHYIPGRIWQVRLHIYRAHDIYAIYFYIFGIYEYLNFVAKYRIIWIYF